MFQRCPQIDGKMRKNVCVWPLHAHTFCSLSPPIIFSHSLRPYIEMPYLRNACREFLQICHKCSIWIKNELNRIWRSNVKVTSQNLNLAIIKTCERHISGTAYGNICIMDTNVHIDAKINWVEFNRVQWLGAVKGSKVNFTVIS